MTLSLFLALLLAYVGSVAAQSSASRPAAIVLGGLATGGPSNAVLVGLELRTPELSRLSLAIEGGVWGFVGFGCDLSTGPGCPGETAMTIDVGPVVRLGPGDRPWRVEATARLGRLWYNGGENGLWKPSAGLGLGLWQSRRVSGLLGMRYHALMGSPLPSIHRGTEDRLVFFAGLRIRL